MVGQLTLLATRVLRTRPELFTTKQYLSLVPSKNQKDRLTTPPPDTSTRRPCPL